MLMALRKDFIRITLNSYKSNLFPFLCGHTATMCVVVMVYVNKCEKQWKWGRSKTENNNSTTNSEHLRIKKEGKALTVGRGGTKP